MPADVYFIGAGPGDPDLITVKGKHIIDRADVIIYADSLVSPQVCAGARPDAEIHKSSSMTLEEMTTIMVDAVGKGKSVARLHTGDPAIFGAIQEQMIALDRHGIRYEIIPGVSSLFAAAAALKTELTIPGLTQTVIVTRMGGKTPVPEAEDLRKLAAHQSSMAIFLSASLAGEVASELIAGGYRPETPVAVVYQASWENEKVLRCTVETLAARITSADITKHAIILVGEFLNSRETDPRSRLYHQDFRHGYRK